jgi:ABC-type Zn uptake system ZnuABC Zn-binding protein ZnuA
LGIVFLCFVWLPARELQKQESRRIVLAMDARVGRGHRLASSLRLGLLAVAIAVAGCSGETGGSGGPGSDGRLQVVTTVSPITSIAANVIGENAAITGIVPEGTNSHTFEPPPSTSAVLSEADVVFVNGLKLEDPTLELAEQTLKDGAQIVELGTTVLPESQWIYDLSFPKEDGKPNPHLWTDPLYAIKYAAVIRDTMTNTDPANQAAYRANYTAFEQKVTALSDALKKDQATIPGGKRELLTYHDAYAYFAKDYGWKVIGAIQPKDFEDPTPREVAALIDQIKQEQVPTIFGSEVFPSKVLEQIGKETGARYEDTLRDDDLPGKPGDSGHSWLGLMRYDYRTMIRGLGGTTAALDALEVTDVAPDRATYPQ